ncbi:MAG: HAMP domain-containing histidine kinase [Methyloversatilis discipulorum]|uniref:sensor histidine kinase n=1 Tax=Methyloversatilis discipulorum TaxID=1119528 RepID=UPI0026EEA9E0|nr:HAMP domain-containing sensor histidine kinase [Methyloversatilis discipulorum]MBT9519004.1 HAMP domain-containing histidine kinase [Methyloversatilis discipulorum]
MSLRLSTSARLTLANSALLAAGFGLLLMLVTWLAGQYMLGHVEESVEAELDILTAEFRVDGVRGISGLIRQRLDVRSANHDRVYRLEDAAGNLLIGNLNRWPDSAGRESLPLRLPSLLHRGQTEIVARWVRLPDGSRLLVGFDEYEVEQVRSDIRRAALVSFGLMLLASLGGGYLITRAALRPVETIRRAAQQIMDGDLQHRVPLRSGDGADEFDRLAQTLNGMLDRIARLIATVRGATDNIAHDLRSPLTRHRARIEAALSHPPTADELPDWLERNLADVDQVLSTFQSLLRIARVDSGLLRGEFSELDVGRLVRDAIELMEPLAEERGLRLVVSAPEGAACTGHRDLLFQTVLNLIDNAIKYSPHGGTVELSLTRDGDDWRLCVRDEGPGIPAAERERVFERLYRLESARDTPGLGLGLSLVQSVVALHRGTIALDDAAPGLAVTLRLPARPAGPH